MEATDPILERIRRLYALSKDPSNEAEATSAATKCRELLDRYNLELGAVELLDQGAFEQPLGSPRKRTEVYVHFLIEACQKLFGIGGYWLHTEGQNGHQQTPMYYGPKANVEAAITTFNYFVKSIQVLYQTRNSLRVQLAGLLFQRRSSDGYNRSEFLAGAAMRIRQLVTEELKRRKAAETTETTALIRVTDAIVQKHWEMLLKKFGGQMRTDEVQAQEGSPSLLAGWEAGGTVDIGGVGKKLE